MGSKMYLCKKVSALVVPDNGLAAMNFTHLNGVVKSCFPSIISASMTPSSFFATVPKKARSFNVFYWLCKCNGIGFLVQLLFHDRRWHWYLMSGSAPYSRSSWQHSSLLARTERWRAVCPQLSRLLQRALWRSKTSILFKLPCSAAKWRAVFP